MFGVQFYPTPELIAERVWNKIDWQRVKSLLEPSAGKGDLLVGINRSENKEHELFSGKKIMIDTVPRKVKFIDCIEIDSNLASILREKGYNVIVGDFLNHHTYTRYDCILMNPPFKEGDKHLMKALDMCKFGGQVCCILNAETIKNPCSTIRQELISRLENYNADIEFIEHGFRDSERKTDVEIAIVYVDIPKIQYNEDILSSMKIADEYKNVEDGIANDCQLATNDIISNIIMSYNEACKKGLSIIDSFERVKNIIPTTNMFEGDKCAKQVSLIDISINTSEHDKGYSLQNQYLRQLRRQYWEKLFSYKEISDLLTQTAREKYQGELERFRDFDFTLSNIKALQLELSNKMNDNIEEAIMKQFDKLTFVHSMDKSSNVHYYNGWKTNDAFKVNKKCIVSAYGVYDNRWCQSWSIWHSRDYLSELEKVLTYVNGGVSDDSIPDAWDVIRDNEKTYNGEKIHFRFFDVEYKKKNTMHIWFTNEEVLKKFNIYAGKNKGWLPNDYGTKTYKDLNESEKNLADSFEGEKSYNETYTNANYYLASASVMALAMN